MLRRRLLSRPLFAPIVTTLATALLATTIVAPASTADPVDLLRPPEEKRPPTERVDRTFTVASLNILGSQHTRGGDHDRTVRTARLIREQHVAVTGLQEVQVDQHRWLEDRLPGYRIWPGTRFGTQGIRLQIAWRKQRFDLIDHGTVTTTFSHQQRPIPWVRLVDRQTSRQFSVIDVHNSPGSQEADRDAATAAEIDLYQRLRDRGPVLIVGDANERGEWFCKVTGATDARAANGGRHRDGCRPPSPAYVDWLMGGGRMQWQDYRARETRVSDHLLHTAVFRWGRG